MARRKLGILVGGGPAPGINGVINAVTIEAINNDLEVIGIFDGFKWLSRGDATHVQRLKISDVSRIHSQGGSILRTARDNPAKNPETLETVAETLKELALDYLVTIGGDDTAYSASMVVEAMKGSLRVAHVPKTIDNDIPLPNNMPTFGFQTARHVGVDVVHNLMEDARTTGRWYLVVTMGRKAGHLTLGIGKAAGATLSIIAEEFGSHTLSLDAVADVLEGAILKRRVQGRPDGVALMAEGIAEHLDPDELKDLPGVEVAYDPHGHIELREIPLAKLVAERVEKRFMARGEKMTIVDLDLGYELRCAPPIPFDCEYVRDLGWGAVTYLLSPDYAGGAIICWDDGRLQPRPFSEMMDPETGRTLVRMVDVDTEGYLVAREYMIRLESGDLAGDRLNELAAQTGETPDAFKARLSACVGLTSDSQLPKGPTK